MDLLSKAEAVSICYSEYAHRMCVSGPVSDEVLEEIDELERQVQAIAIMARLIRKTDEAAMNPILQQTCGELIEKAIEDLKQDGRLYPVEEHAEMLRPDSPIWRVRNLPEA